MEAKLLDGQVAIITDDSDEFGKEGKTERMIPLETAKRLRDQLTAAIKIYEAGSTNMDQNKKSSYFEQHGYGGLIILVSLCLAAWLVYLYAGAK